MTLLYTIPVPMYFPPQWGWNVITHPPIISHQIDYNSQKMRKEAPNL